MTHSANEAPLRAADAGQATHQAVQAQNAESAPAIQAEPVTTPPAGVSAKASTPARPKKLSLGINMAWNSVGSLTYLACQWLITIVIVRLSSGAYDAAGVLSLAMSICNIFAPIANYKMYAYQVSDVQRENTVGEYMGLRIITMTCAFVLCAVYTAITCSATAAGPVLLYFVYKMVSMAIEVMHGQCQINSRMDYIGVSWMLQGAVSLGVFVSVFWLSGSLGLTLACMAGATALVGALYTYPKARQFEPIKVKISRAKAAHLLTSYAPVVIAAVAAGAAPSIPRQLLAYMSGQAALGAWASVAAPIAIIQNGAYYIYGPLLSNIAQHHVDHNRRALFALLGKASAGVAAVGVVCGAVLVVAGPWVLTLLYGQTIAQYTYLILPILVSIILASFVWFFNDVLIAIRCFKGAFVGNIANVVISAALSYGLISVFGLNGVSYTMIAMYAACAALMAAFIIARAAK